MLFLGLYPAPMVDLAVQAVQPLNVHAGTMR